MTEPNQKQPRVSIIVPCYNSERFLGRALDSIVAQTYSDWEIVIVDDGSTDGTARIGRSYVERLGDRCQFFQQANAGSSAARNLGIEASRGELVAFLDSDDEFLPYKLERQVDLFDCCPELGMVYCDYSFVDLNGATHESVFDAKESMAREVPLRKIALGHHLCGESLFDLLLREYFIATIVGMVRRDVLGETIRFPRGRSYAEEWLFYLKIVQGCRVGFVSAPLCLHHHVRGSLSRTNSEWNNWELYQLLLTMERELHALTSSQRGVLNAHLARACRQLSYDTARKDDRWGARGWRVKSFGYSLRNWWHWPWRLVSSAMDPTKTPVATAHRVVPHDAA